MWDGLWDWDQHTYTLDVSVWSISHVQLFVTPWAAACQASLSFTVSWSLLRLMSLEAVMPPNHLIPCYPLLILSSIFPSTFPFFFLFLGTIDTIYNMDKNLFYSTGNSTECYVVASMGRKSKKCWYVCVCMLVIQSCPALCQTTDCSPPGSSAHGIL